MAKTKNSDGLSPMMGQYMEIKKNYEDSILFYRLGDFYEMFFGDAQVASEELDLTLTGRDCGQEKRAPMCGVPFHSCESYIARLIQKGYKVAICDQIEDPATAKGIVKRGVTRVITPGTVVEDSMLNDDRNNYLATFVSSKEGIALCFADVSTGKSYVTEIKGGDLEQRLINEFGRFSPAECVATKEIELYPNFLQFLKNNSECIITKKPNTFFNVKESEELIKKHFKVVSPENLGVESNSLSVSALGATLSYLYETGVEHTVTINEVEPYSLKDFMYLDYSAARNLELCQTMRTKSKKGSLLWVLEKTKTAMGRRMLKSFIEQPLISIFQIDKRLNAVEELVINTVMRGETREYLMGIRDMERLLSKIVYGTANARDLLSLSDTCGKIPVLKEGLSFGTTRLIKEIHNNLDTLEDIYTLIKQAISEDAPNTVREGGMFKKGFNSELDSLIDIALNGANIILEIERREKERTGIKTLKVRYNRVFGYYIEVSNSFLNMVPEDYIRKQTLTNGERFFTEELKTLEGKILGAKEKRERLEYELFEEMRLKVAENLKRFQKTSEAIALIDTLCSLAEVAVNNNYVRPQLNNEGIIRIEEGRHPVVEQISKTPFVSNDTYLDLKDDRCAVITGPNMAGKSTYMRQVALITLLAQIGSFVPATSANISVVDAIFTRVGASDDLASGQSTFMVEMSEVASIIKNATKNSLLILDEIGRGTSTFDGMSIARAVLEYVADKKKLGAKALFATHYHELTEMEQEIKGIKNYNIAVKKRGDDIIFLRRIVRGGTDDSYGIEVAKLAGIPNSVIMRAKEILEKTLAEGVNITKRAETQELQMPMGYSISSEITEELKNIDVNTLTPIECMSVLSELIEKAKEF